MCCIPFLNYVIATKDARTTAKQTSTVAMASRGTLTQAHPGFSFFSFKRNAQNVAYVGRPPFFLCHALKRPDHIRACRRTFRHMGGFLGIPALATQTTPPSTCIDKARALRGRWNFPFSCCAILLILHTNRAKGHAAVGRL